MATDRFNPNLTWWQGVLAVGALVGVVALVGRCTGGSHDAAVDPTDARPAEDKDKEPSHELAPPAPVQPNEAHWYEGGTLHDANGLQWQEASLPNKLATAADILAKLWMSGKLKPQIASKIQGVDDLRGPSSELVVAIDRAFEKKADPKLNRQIFTNQKVSEIAVAVMTMMGWV